jgi:spore germination protein KB
MQGEEKISVTQFCILAFLYTLGTTILVIPSGLAATAKHDAWIGAIAGVCLNLVIVFIFTSLWSLYPNLSFVGICKKILGKYLGGVLSVIFIIYSFIGSTTVLYYVGNFLKTQILVGTPLPYLNALFGIVVILGARLGIEVLGRTAEIFLPWFILLFVFFVVMISPEIEPKRILPIFDSGFKPLVHNSLSIAGTASLPFLSFFMFLPNVNNIKQCKKGFYFSTIAGGVLIVLITFLTVSILGDSMTARNTYPTYVLAKKIHIGDFFQRIEIIIAIMWFITTYFKMSIYFYGMATSMSELLKLKSYRILCYPLGFIVIVFSLFIYPSVTYMMNWDTTIYLPYIFSIAFFIPILLLFVSYIQKKLQAKKNA